MTTSSGSGGPRDDDAGALLSLANGETATLWRVPPGGWQSRIDPPPHGLLSGAFNPRHSGHDGLRAAAETWIGGPIYFELPLTNADKPGLEIDAARARCRQFPDDPLLVTRAATFVEKARILPGMTFVVGVDTAVRVVEHRFYGPAGDPLQAEAAMIDGLDELRQLKCRFLVATRSLRGQVLRLSDVPVPRQFRELFTELPETLFRLDISSSEMRENPSS